MVRRIARCGRERLHDRVRGWQIRIADTQTDDVNARRAPLIAQLVELRE